MPAFTLYPAIDLHNGQVVRLQQGDLARQTTYSPDPVETAARWRAAGADWLHVVNLDGAFGLDQSANRRALTAILHLGGAVQFGGGVRTLEDIAALLDLGVARVVLGTAAIESPDLVSAAISRFGAAAIAVGLDARDGRLQTRGWTRQTARSAADFARELAAHGLRTVIHTDIARDGLESGVNADASRQLTESSGLDVIASGGVATLDDIRRCRAAGLAGVVIGRALYESRFTLEEALQC
ncbi:MAG: 1-(5-phosphoribosyl)-5-[(5-phosphoribosylamino) methylideneamino]imidazole-4-carboxamide isomerase [Anaerolineales bacterium]